MGKMENKYTLKIKSCGSAGLADDGYKWRKYGQKTIKNSPNPRSFFFFSFNLTVSIKFLSEEN